MEENESLRVFELHEVKCVNCGKPIPCCFFYCTKCEIEMFDKWEARIK